MPRKKRTLNLAKKQTIFGDLIANERKLSDFIPYSTHYDDTIIRTKDGDLLSVIKVSGLCFETLDDHTIDLQKAVRANLLLSAYDARIGLYYNIVRRHMRTYPKGLFGSEWVNALDDAYLSDLKTKQMFVNEHYLTVVLRPFKSGKRVAHNLMNKVEKLGRSETEEQTADILRSKVSDIISSLKDYKASVLSVYDKDGCTISEPMSFFYYLLNQEVKDVALQHGIISEHLATKRITFGNESFEIRGPNQDDIKYGVLLSLKQYGTTTKAGLLDDVLRLPHEMIISESFLYRDKEDALNQMQVRQRVQSIGVDIDESTISTETAQAIDDQESGAVIFGDHHLTVCLYEHTEFQLKESISSTISAFQQHALVREDTNLQPAFFAQLPGNFAYIARKSLIHNLNFAGFMSLHNFPAGSKDRNHWGDAVCLLETTSHTPYFFNFHERDVGNFTLIGPTGSGKTLLLGFLIAQAQRFSPKVFYFDKDRGAEIFIRGMEGTYTIIKKGQSTNLNPLKLDDTIENRSFLFEWLSVILTINDDHPPLTTEEQGILQTAIAQLMQMDKVWRSFSELADNLGGYDHKDAPPMNERIMQWTAGGAKGWLFDNPTDSLDFDSKICAFDMTEILDDNTLKTPWLRYIFHRIQQSMDGEKVMIILDEAWKMLSDETFQQKIIDWSKTIRKQNGLIGFATQSPNDVLALEGAESIIEQAPTQIFLPNPKATKKAYVEGLKLEDAEFDIIRTSDFTSRTFLIKHGVESVVAKLDLSDLPDFIHVLSARAESVMLLDKIRARYGDNFVDWHEPFITEINLLGEQS